MEDMNSYYEILGLGPGASQEQVKQAYRDLAKVWHPDRFAHDPRLQQKAQEKLKGINEAYEHIRSSPPSPPTSASPQREGPRPSTTRSGPRPSRQSFQKQKSRAPLVFGAVLVVAAALALIAWNSTGGTSKNTPIATSPTPIATASVRESLEAFRGKVVILDIWATWCPPCRMEIPDFIKLQDKYRDQGLEIVGVSIDPYDSRGGPGAAAVAPFMQQYKINYHVWTINSPTALAGYPMGQGIPTTYVLDRSGRISKTYVGAQPMAVFENEVKSLL